MLLTLRTLVAFMTPVVEELTWELAGLSAETIAYVDSVVEYVRSTEKLPGVVESIEPAAAPPNRRKPPPLHEPSVASDTSLGSFTNRCPSTSTVSSRPALIR